MYGQSKINLNFPKLNLNAECHQKLIKLKSLIMYLLCDQRLSLS